MSSATARFRFDLLARAVDGVQERTVCGALVTLGSVVVIAMLLVFECKSFLTATVVHHIGVDDGDKPFGSDRWTLPEQIPIELYMTFAHVDCDSLSLELDAARGDEEPAVAFRPPTPQELEWTRDASVDVAKACTLEGHMMVGKVSANFRVEIADRTRPSEAARETGGAAAAQLGLAFQAYASQMYGLEQRKFVNISHRVHSLHFGKRILAGTVAPLDGVVNAPIVPGQQHYLMKVIPTIVDRGTWGTVATNQYSLAEQFLRYDSMVYMPYVILVFHSFFRSFFPFRGRPNSMLGVFFYYDFFPVMIQVVQRQPSLSQFLVSICVSTSRLSLKISSYFFLPRAGHRRRRLRRIEHH